MSYNKPGGGGGICLDDTIFLPFGYSFVKITDRNLYHNSQPQTQNEKSAS